jgi:1,2-phenylacetyl-CoA epoxidase catalytic subunit
LVSVDFLTNAWVNWSDFLVAHWLIDWWKVPFDDQLRQSSKMVAMAAILDLVSIEFLSNAWVDWSDFLVAHWR